MPLKWAVTQETECYNNVGTQKSVFSLSIQAQIIAQAIGQAFGVAYQQFLQENGVKTDDLRPGEFSDYLESQELYNGDLAHFSDSQNIRDVSRRLVATCLYSGVGV